MIKHTFDNITNAGMTPQIILIDLDGTVADSSHRYATLPNGDIDLPFWVKQATPANIAKDKVLPLTAYIRRLALSSTIIPVIVTARVMQKADYAWIDENNIPNAMVISRAEGDTSGDATLKILALKNLAGALGVSWQTFCNLCHAFDDNPSILSAYKQNKIAYTNAKIYNAKAA